MERELFQKVYIKSESDLPKDNNNYYWHRRVGKYNTIIETNHCEGDEEYEVLTFDWYLRPLLHPVRKTAEDYIWSTSINKGLPGIVKTTNPPELVCFCNEEQSKVIINALNAAQGIDWPSEEESNKILDKKAFRVPYHGSDNFYDESFIKGWKACYEWFLKRLKK